MQLTGSRFTDATAVVGNDLATLPDFPAEIRAPAGTPHGVSAFQIHFASRDILTPGDNPNVLVAMNPAALITNVGSVEKGGTVIVNEDGFSDHNLRKAGYTANPLEDDSLDEYQLFRVPMTSMTVRATEGIEGITSRDASRSKNLFALGLVSWLYSRPTEPTVDWIDKKFAEEPPIRDANLAAFRAGYNFGETAELLAVHYEVDAAPAPPGTYRNVNGTSALALGLIAASVRSGLGLFYASYPITPASEVLHYLSRHKQFGVQTVQAEDEIAAVNMALGAAFAGQLGVTATSGPGMDLKAETVGLAVAMELPMVIVDVQRAGPSTGMPTKTEAADLLMALYGRHGESPLPVIAASTPGGCFYTAIEAVRIAVKYRTPVILLSDTFLANSSEPWMLPDVASLPKIDPGFATLARRLHAVRARREPGAAVGDPGHAGPAPPHRRPREGGRDGEHLLRGREPRAHDAAAGGAHSADRGRRAGYRGRRSRRRRDAARARLGLDLWRDPGCRAAGAPRERREGGGRPLRPPQPDAAQPRAGAALLRAGAGARDEHGPAREGAARGVPDRLRELHEGRRHADLHARRDGPDPGAGGMSETNGHGTGNGADPTVLTKADFSSDQETRWCPGCGDYAILASVQGFMPELGIPPDRIVFVTGIGCAGRFVYYMDTYGMHGIHGRAPALATGVAASRPDLSVWVVSGDGDSLSIGGNHLIHALRRNVPLKILLFNNQIYGLTKGQYSPTSEEGKVTKSTPFGSQDHPFNPVALALGAEATFVARTVDTDKKHVAATLRAAAAHEGAAFVEIYQNCNVFNDGAFDAVRAKGAKELNQIPLVHGEPIRFGAEDERGVVRGETGRLELAEIADVGEDAVLVHDAERHDPAFAFELAQLAQRPTGPTPIGVFRSVKRPVYGVELAGELKEARAKVGDDELERLLHSGETWTVS